MVDMERDFIEYLSGEVKIVRHRELGLVMFLRKENTDSIQRALTTTGYKISGKKKKLNGSYYYSLEEDTGGN
jgi:hypothetical protein